MDAQEAITLAIEAKNYVKDLVPLTHSDNKTIDPDLNSRKIGMRQQDILGRKGLSNKNIVDAIREHRKAPLAPGASVGKVLAYGEHVCAAAYGNCLEMSCAAAWYLNSVRGEFDCWDLVYYSAKRVLGAGINDHIFVSINEPEPHGGNYPTDFATWSASAAICDVWGDIACLARDYPERWRARMHNWRLSGILIGSQSPTEAMWKDVVDTQKSSYIHV